MIDGQVASAVVTRLVDSSWISAYDSGEMAEGKKSAPASTLAVVLSAISVVVLIIGSVAGCTLWISSRFADVGTRIGKVEASVKVLASQQSDKVNDLIKGLLSEVGSNAAKGDSELAVKAAKAASVFINVQKRNRSSSPPEFFQDSVAILNTATPLAPPQSELYTELLKTRIALAEYRSAAEPTPSGTILDFRPIKPGQTAFTFGGRDSGLRGINLLLENNSYGLKFGPPLKGALSEGLVFADGIIKGGTQTLDGIH